MFHGMLCMHHEVVRMMEGKNRSKDACFGDYGKVQAKATGLNAKEITVSREDLF